MKVARITTVIALVATLATPLAASANPSTNEREIKGRTLTSIEAIRYGRSERSDPNWDRVEPRSAGQGSSQPASQR
jgi:hypothetical protein